MALNNLPQVPKPFGLYVRDATTGREDLVYELPKPQAREPEPEPGAISRATTGFGRGIVRGGLSTASLVTEATGFEDTSESLDRAAAEWKRDVAGIEEIAGPSDFFVWGSEVLAENASNLALIAGSAATGGWLAAGAAGLRAAAMGGLAGAATSDVLLQKGETEKTLKAAGVEPTLLNTMPVALGKAMLDLVPLVAVARRIGFPPSAINKAVTEAAEQSGILRRTAEGLGYVLGEATTEGAQEFLEIVNEQIAVEGRARGLNAEEWLQIANATAAGAVAGGPLAVLATVAGKRPGVVVDEDEAPARVVEPEPQKLLAPPQKLLEPPSVLAGETPETVEPPIQLGPPAQPEAPPAEPVAPVEDPKPPELEQLFAAASRQVSKFIDSGGPIPAFDYAAARLVEGAGIQTVRKEILDAVQKGRPPQDLASLKEYIKDATNFTKQTPRLVYVPESELGRKVYRGFSDIETARRSANFRGERFVPAIPTKSSVLSFNALHYFDPKDLNVLKDAPSDKQEREDLRAITTSRAMRIQGPPDLSPAAKKFLGDAGNPFDGQQGFWGKSAQGAISRRTFRGASADQNDTASYVKFDQALGKEAVVADSGIPDWIARIAQTWAIKYLGGDNLVLASDNVGGRLVGTNNASAGILPSYRKPLVVLSKNTLQNEEQTLLVTAHEMGHAITFKHYDDAPQALKSAVARSYFGYVERVRGMSKEAFRRRGGLGETVPGGNETITDLERSSPVFARYLLSFSEWMAHQATIYLQREAAVHQGMRGWLGELVGKLRKFYRDVRGILGEPVKPEEGFQEFMRYAIAASKLERELPAIDPQAPKAYSGEPQAAAYENDIEKVFHKTDVPPTVAHEAARFGKLQEYGLTLIQNVQRYGFVPGMREYLAGVERQRAEKVRITAQADDVLREWRKLGKEKGQAPALTNFLFDVTRKSDRLHRKLTPEELDQIANHYGLKPSSMEMFNKIQGTLQGVIQELEAAQIANARRTFTDPELFAQYVQLTKEEFAKIRNRHYFPLMRFGKWGIRVTATKANVEWDGKVHPKAGDLMTFETFETRRARDARIEQLKRLVGENGKVEDTYLEDSQFSFLGFPSSVVESMKDQLKLTVEQRDSLEKIVFHLSPGQSFKKHLLRRRGISGFSQDAMRAYASYMMNASGHVARAKHTHELRAAMKQVSERKDTLGHQLHQYLAGHFDYFNNPGEEWAGLRAAFFIYYLGFSPKSALVNSTQVGLVAWPWLSARFGDASSFGAIVKSYRDVTSHLRSGKGLTLDEIAMFEQGRNEGWLDEGLYAELAAVAEGENLSRFAPMTETGRRVRQFSAAAAYMFQAVEKYNRQVTALAAYRLSQKDPAFTKEAVQSTMFEYAAFNRPAFMRGRKSVFFLFQMFVQNMVYLAVFDKARTRILFALLAAAGLQGVPGAEDILDLFDLGSSWIKRLTGWGDPRSDARTYIREIAADVGADPDLVMNGLGRFSMGLGFLGMPDYDVSGSLSMGRVVPGLQPLARGLKLGTTDTGQLVGRTLEDVGGAIPAAGVRFFEAMLSNNPDSLKRFEMLAPSAARDLLRAYEMASRGEITSNYGDKITEVDVDDPQGMGMVIGQALGFRPTEVAQIQTRNLARRDAETFYSARIQMLLTQYFHARKTGDREAVADVNSAIDRFNSQVPFPEMRITYAQRNNSYKDRLKNQRKREAGESQTRKYRRLGEEFETPYPVPEGSRASPG